MAAPDEPAIAEGSRLLNPEMVYRPPTAPPYNQPRQAGRRADDDNGGDDDGDDNKPITKFRLHAIAIFRITALLIAFIAFILWASSSIRRSGIDVTISITLWLVIVFQGLLIVPRSVFGDHKTGESIKCTVGLFTCIFGSPDDDSDDPEGGSGRKTSHRLFSLVDFLFGLVLMIVMIVGSASPRYNWGFYNYGRLAPAILTWILMVLEYIIAITTHLPLFQRVVIYVYPDNGDDVERARRYQYRIRLPQEAQPRWARESAKHVSIAA